MTCRTKIRLITLHSLILIYSGRRSTVILNSLPIHKILDWSKSEAFADDKIKVLIPLPNRPLFLHVCCTYMYLLKTPWERKKLLVTSNFSFSHSVFYPFGELSAIFIRFEIVIWKICWLGRVL